MNALAGAIDDLLNGEDCPPDKRKLGFFLSIFPFGDVQGRMNYISNAEGADVRAMLTDILARIDGRLAEPGHG
jgi:hypothetical protein